MLVLFIRTMYHWLFFSFSILCHQGLAVELVVETKVWDFFIAEMFLLLLFVARLDTSLAFHYTKKAVARQAQNNSKVDCTAWFFLSFLNIYLGKDS